MLAIHLSTSLMSKALAEFGFCMARAEVFPPPLSVSTGLSFVRLEVPRALRCLHCKPFLDGRKEVVELLHILCQSDRSEMDQGVPPTAAVFEGADLEQAEHSFGNQFKRDSFLTRRQSPYASASYSTLDGFVRESQVAFPSSAFSLDGFSRDVVSKDGDNTKSEAGSNKRPKRADWWQESQGVDRSLEPPKNISPNKNAPPAVPAFRSPVSPYRGPPLEGNVVESDIGASSGEGERKKRAEMWQDAEMDALVRAFWEVHTKLTSAEKKGKQVFKSANDKWSEVRTLLLAAGVDRQPKEIKLKWWNLSIAFKQIADWNKKAGCPSYWDLSKKEKTKAKELPATFRSQLFNTMAEFMGDRGQGARGRAPAQETLGHGPVPGLPRPPPAPGVVEVALPTEKLVHANLLDATYRKRLPVVLLSPGSFNPPTYMHLRMFELGKDALTAEGYHVLGGYLSPVNDQYHKKGLAPAEHRIRMCQLAIADSPFLIVDPWEAKQNSYQRTLTVLARIEMAVNSNYFAADAEKVRVMLLCGADLLESITTPGVWIPDQVRTLLQEYGLVCINRDGKDARHLVFEHDILYNNRRQILVVDEIIQNNISATAIRLNLSRGLSVRYLTPDAVIDYMKLNHLYMNVPPLQQS